MSRLVKAINQLRLLALAACLGIAGCASSPVDTSVDSTKAEKWKGLFIDDLVDKLSTPDSVTELAGGGKSYQWSRTETVETYSYSNYKRSVPATCIFQVRTTADATIKNVSYRGHDKVCQYFSDRL